MYFKAEVSISTEELELNPKTGVYEGCNPETYQDHGVVQTFTAPTLEELKAKISREFFNLENPVGADVQIFENRIDIQYQGEHDYRTPREERVPFIETASICISQVEETQVDLESNALFASIDR